MDETLSLVEKFLDFSRRSNLGPELCLEPGCVHVVDLVQRHRLHTHRLPDLLDRRYVIRLVRVGDAHPRGTATHADVMQGRLCYVRPHRLRRDRALSTCETPARPRYSRSRSNSHICPCLLVLFCLLFDLAALNLYTHASMQLIAA